MHWSATILLAPAFALAQSGAPVHALPATLPPGLLLPVHLEHEVRSGSSPAGSAIRARLAQRVPLSADSYLSTKTELLGTVVASTPTTLTLRFDRLRLAGQTLPVQTRGVALANFIAVSDAAVPCTGAVDRANSDAANWTTCQVGGAEVVRSGWSGPVLDASTHIVGFADFYGVYTTPAAPGAVPYALGVFSPGATGLFGYGPDVMLSSAPGNVTLTSVKPVTLHAGDNLLLRIGASTAQ